MKKFIYFAFVFFISTFNIVLASNANIEIFKDGIDEFQIDSSQPKILKISTHEKEYLTIAKVTIDKMLIGYSIKSSNKIPEQNDLLMENLIRTEQKTDPTCKLNIEGDGSDGLQKLQFNFSSHPYFLVGTINFCAGKDFLFNIQNGNVTLHFTKEYSFDPHVINKKKNT